MLPSDSNVDFSPIKDPEAHDRECLPAEDLQEV